MANGATEDRTAEQWEASDHIEALKESKRRLQVSRGVGGVCKEHDALAYAVEVQAGATIWQIRHTDMSEKRHAAEPSAPAANIGILEKLKFGRMEAVGRPALLISCAAAAGVFFGVIQWVSLRMVERKAEKQAITVVDEARRQARIVARDAWVERSKDREETP